MIFKNNFYSFFAIAVMIILITTVYACSKKSASPIVEETPSISELINDEMGKKVTTIDNEAGTHVLCIKKEDNLVTSYMVISKEGEVVVDRKKVKGTVAWHDNGSIKVTTIPGVVDKRQDQAQGQKTIIPIRKRKEAI